MPELLRRLRATDDALQLQETLGTIATKWRRDAGTLEFLMNHPEPDVLETLVSALASFRGNAARTMLERLAAHPDERVQRAARSQLSNSAS
ncbi:MAG TPA: hypothetical protein VFE76_07670 [Myxococcales bacterium]|nr:hypothetical protein [Myxococcales bacterium]HZX93134.1 hypothetical protein [Myxococcales bacterium]